jgi:hypothetical protein
MSRLPQPKASNRDTLAKIKAARKRREQQYGKSLSTYKGAAAKRNMTKKPERDVARIEAIDKSPSRQRSSRPKMHASGMTQAEWDKFSGKTKEYQVSKPGTVNQRYYIDKSGRTRNEKGLLVQGRELERLKRMAGTGRYERKDDEGNLMFARSIPQLKNLQYDPEGGDPRSRLQRILSDDSNVLPTSEDRTRALEGGRSLEKMASDKWGLSPQMVNEYQSYATGQPQGQATHQPYTAGQMAATRGNQVQAGYKTLGTSGTGWRTGQPNVYQELGFSPEQAALDQRLVNMLGSTYDPLQKQIDEYTQQSEEALQNVMSTTQGLYDAEIDQIQQETESKLNALDSQVNNAVEQTASRFAFSGFGRSSEHLGAQAQIQAEGVRAKNALQQEMTAKTALLRAQKAGASSEHLAALQQNVLNAQAKKAEIQQGINDLVSQQRLKMLETNEQNKAMQEVEAEKLAQERTAAQNEYLEMQGLTINPFTGEVEKLPQGANKASAQLSEAMGYLVDEFGRPITDERGEIQNIMGDKDYQMKTDAIGNTYVFDPSTGQVVGQYDMFGNFTGGTASGMGVPTLDDFANLVGGGGLTPQQVEYAEPQIGNTLQSAVESTGKSRYRKNGYECAEAVNRITDGYHLGSNYSDKMKQVTKQSNPQVGNALVIPYGSEKYGHAEMAISTPDAQGNFKTASWNKRNDGQFSIETHNINDLRQKYGNNWGFTDSQLKTDVKSQLTTLAGGAMPQMGAQPSMPSMEMPQTGGVTEDMAYREAISRGLIGQDAIMAAKSWAEAGYIPEDPAAAERAELEAGKEREEAYRKAKQTQVMSTLDQVINNLDQYNTGIVGAASSNIPGTSAYNLAKQIDTLKANIGFGELQAMREASKTGGALGQVSEREMAYLNSVLGSMDIGQSKEQLAQNLENIKQSLTAFYNAGGGQFMEGATPSMPTTSSGGSAADMLAEYGIY